MVQMKIKKHFIKYFVLIVLILSLSIGGLKYCKSSVNIEKSSCLMDYGIEIYDVLINGAQGSGENEERKDILRDCPSVLKVLRFGGSEEITEDVLSIIDHYMELYYEYGYFPREPYEPVPGGGYVSSMDAPLLGVCCELAYERTGNDRYKEYLLDLIPYLILSTDQNGYVLKEDDNNWWPLEYAWKDVTEDNAWYVYNGSLYGMVSIELLKNCTNDSRLHELSNKAISAYKKHSKDFYYYNHDWCWYSLNGSEGIPIINLSEKLFIEMRALSALYLLTHEQFYQEEYDRRVEIWSSLYPVYKIEKEKYSELYFLRAGAPHPYYVDIYPTVLKIYDSKKELIETIESPSREAEFCYIKEGVSCEAEFYELYAKINDISPTLISKGELKSIKETDISPIDLDYEYSFWGDCENFDGKTIYIDKELDVLEKSFISFKLDTIQKNTVESYWVFDVTNNTKDDFAIQVVLMDTEGRAISRYLQTLKPGNNSLIFNYLGFKSSNQSIKNVETVQLDLIDNSLKTNHAELVLNEFLYCENTAQVVEYLSSKQYDDFWYYRSSVLY